MINEERKKVIEHIINGGKAELNVGKTYWQEWKPQTCNYHPLSVYELVEWRIKPEAKVIDLEGLHDDMRSLDDIRRIVELETPDMFWVRGDTEKFIYDPKDAFEDIMCESVKVGAEITFEQAASLPSATYVLTKINGDGSFEIMRKPWENKND